MRSYSCILLAIVKNEEVPGSFSSSLDTLFAANNLPKLHLGDFQPPTIGALRNMETLLAKDKSPMLSTTPLQVASSRKVPAVLSIQPVTSQNLASDLVAQFKRTM